MSPSHINSGYKDTESEKMLLLHCWCVILAGEKNLLVCQEILMYGVLRFILHLIEVQVRYLWLSPLSSNIDQGVECQILLYAEEQVKEQKQQILKDLSVQCPENPIQQPQLEQSLKKSVTNHLWYSEVSCANCISSILETVKSSQQLVELGWDFDAALILSGMSSLRPGHSSMSFLELLQHNEWE